jgi:hypothetical protein
MDRNEMMKMRENWMSDRESMKYKIENEIDEDTEFNTGEINPTEVPHHLLTPNRYSVKSLIRLTRR